MYNNLTLTYMLKLSSGARYVYNYICKLHAATITPSHIKEINNYE